MSVNQYSNVNNIFYAFNNDPCLKELQLQALQALLSTINK